MPVARRSPRLNHYYESGLFEDHEKSFRWPQRTWEMHMSPWDHPEVVRLARPIPKGAGNAIQRTWERHVRAWDHHCRLAGPIQKSAVNAIFARSDWAARLPPAWEWFPCVWLHRAVVEIQSHRDLHTLIVHAPHEADVADAIRSFSGSLYDSRPQTVSYRNDVGPSVYQMDFTPIASDAPLARTPDELIRWLGADAVRWLDLIDRRPGDPRVVFASSDGPAAPRQFIHELAELKQATHAVFVYGADMHALMREGRVDIEFQRIRLIEEACMRRAIVVIDNVAELLGGDEGERQKVLNFMAAWAHGLGASRWLPLVIGLLPNTTAARASALLPQRWHACEGWHLPSHPADFVVKEAGDF